MSKEIVVTYRCLNCGEMDEEPNEAPEYCCVCGSDRIEIQSINEE